MNYELIKQYLLGDLTLEFTVAFYIFSIVGMLLTMLIHLKDSKDKVKKAGKKFNFSIRFWLRDNWLRIATNLLMVFVILRFYNSLHLDYKLDMFLGFATGFSIDTIIIFIREKTKINVFQTTKTTTD